MKNILIFSFLLLGVSVSQAKRPFPEGVDAVYAKAIVCEKNKKEKSISGLEKFAVFFSILEIPSVQGIQKLKALIISYKQDVAVAVDVRAELGLNGKVVKLFLNGLNYSQAMVIDAVTNRVIVKANGSTLEESMNCVLLATGFMEWLSEGFGTK